MNKVCSSVTVYLSTYNGEKYIREQIDSILQQSDVQVTLWIRDDGSKDGTPGIIADYTSRFENVRLLAGAPLGVGRSFMSLVYNQSAPTDFYAFADQDDIWDADKLCVACRTLSSLNDQPALYVCNQRCVDFQGNFMSNRFPDVFPPLKFNNVLFSNLYAGCTMVFNRRLMELLKDEKRRPPLDFFQHRIHDAWVCCVATLVGRLIYDPKTHMSFRRHNTNVTDAEVTRGKRFNVKTTVKLYTSKIKRRFRRKGTQRNPVELTARYLLIGYGDMINERDRQLLEMVRDYRSVPKYRLKLLFGSTIKGAVPEKRFDYFVKIALGIM